MSFAKRPVSMLTAGLLALACAGSPDRTVASEVGPAETTSPQVPSARPSPAGAAPAVESQAAHTDARSEPGMSARAGKSPMQALNQMLTTQALLVTLLFAPLSKGGAEAPLASVDSAPSRAP